MPARILGIRRCGGKRRPRRIGPRRGIVVRVAEMDRRDGRAATGPAAKARRIAATHHMTSRRMTFVVRRADMTRPSATAGWPPSAARWRRGTHAPRQQRRPRCLRSRSGGDPAVQRQTCRPATRARPVTPLRTSPGAGDASPSEFTYAQATALPIGMDSMSVPPLPDPQAEVMHEAASLRRYATTLAVARVAAYIAYAWDQPDPSDRRDPPRW